MGDRHSAAPYARLSRGISCPSERTAPFESRASPRWARAKDAKAGLWRGRRGDMGRAWAIISPTGRAAGSGHCASGCPGPCELALLASALRSVGRTPRCSLALWVIGGRPRHGVNAAVFADQRPAELGQRPWRAVILDQRIEQAVDGVELRLLADADERIGEPARRSFEGRCGHAALGLRSSSRISLRKRSRRT